jgi:DNA-binding GntR family transcriptional regulator
VEQLVSPKKLVDQAYAAILDAICDGTLKPGARLTQHSVAARLRVSRQPIHNALLVLKAQGFVQETGRRGLAVVPLDPKLFAAIYEFRSAVEPLAVRLAVARLTPEAIVRGRALIKAGKAKAKGKNARARIQADMDFHFFIYELADNSLILETMRLNWQHLRRAMGEVLRSGELSNRVWPEHEAVLEAMIEGRAERASTLMREHVVRAYQDVASALSAPDKRPSRSA